MKAKHLKKHDLFKVPTPDPEYPVRKCLIPCTGSFVHWGFPEDAPARYQRFWSLMGGEVEVELVTAQEGSEEPVEEASE